MYSFFAYRGKKTGTFAGGFCTVEGGFCTMVMGRGGNYRNKS